MINFMISFTIGLAIGLYSGRKRAECRGWSEIIKDLYGDISGLAGSAWMKIASLFRKGEVAGANADSM